jgi:hypothetical protein
MLVISKQGDVSAISTRRTTRTFLLLPITIWGFVSVFTTTSAVHRGEHHAIEGQPGEPRWFSSVVLESSTVRVIPIVAGSTYIECVDFLSSR